MSQVINFAPGELNDLIVAELVSGRKMRAAQEKARERAAAQEAIAARGHKTIKGLGKLALTIPEDDYFDLIQKYGQEAMHDRTFLKDMQRLEPQFKVASL
jgi:hypothetical protein